MIKDIVARKEVSLRALPFQPQFTTTATYSFPENTETIPDVLVSTMRLHSDFRAPFVAKAHLC